jgi:hypothetical protein
MHVIDIAQTALAFHLATHAMKNTKKVLADNVQEFIMLIQILGVLH